MSKTLIDLLRNKARSFVYSTALVLGTIAASLASLRYLKANPEIINSLWDNIELLKSGLEKLCCNLLSSNSAIIPIMIGDKEKTMKLSADLLKEEILAPGIRPPTVPKVTSRIRVTVMANHINEDKMLLQR